ncbi:carbohydrate ABC transporter permease [Nocardioides ganghwensis]|jgi:alpha-glucoside transport system permease protein|uniref:Sugar ABC transporter permease n=1 Tax=Nocardioides ganghwensis TaxID=252230 RepID=A0A4Q2S8Y3_9ACTN|nr:sugar ABC transporter permease [Nocardioides ganghwensis]MBD3944317.1 sugar ABC transporter permease [Nocardioides ganghwensis]RYC00078.1 sugar ABC transporter permease [Nocardioides ganghwensis]
MLLKILNALITVGVGVGAAVILYWLLNKLAEVLPGRWEDRLKPYFYILPAYAALVFYLVYPAVQTVVYSFANAQSTAWVGLDNYTRLLQSSSFQDTLFNTLLWMAVVPAMTVVLGLAMAVLADRLNPTWENTSKTIIFLPMAISFVGAGTVWGLIYNYRPEGREQIGLQNAIITALGFDPVAWLQVSDFRLNSFFLMMMLLWAQTGFSMVLLSAAVKGVPEDTLEAARIDGANERAIFFQVVVPQIWGSVITVYVTTLIGVMKIFDIVYVMTNGGANTNVIGNEFFNQLFTNFNNGAAAAIVVLLMLATIPIMVYQVRNFRREESMA